MYVYVGRSCFECINAKIQEIMIKSFNYVFLYARVCASVLCVLVCFVCVFRKQTI